jgi:hypothetical protein
LTQTRQPINGAEGNDLNPGCVFPVPVPMFRQKLLQLVQWFRRFERWFDRCFGWFFTNGMKNRGIRGQAPEPTEGRPFTA